MTWKKIGVLWIPSFMLSALTIIVLIFESKLSHRHEKLMAVCQILHSVN